MGFDCTHALPFTRIVVMILMMFLGSPSFTRKYGAAARISLKGAVLCRAIIVSHCLSVICSCINIYCPEGTLVRSKIVGAYPPIAD